MSCCGDFELFFLWLVSHETNGVVGYPGRCFHSPLALFFSQQSGCVIGEDGMRYGYAHIDIDRWNMLPRWAQWFALLCERSFGCALSAYEAVEVLAEVEVMLGRG